MILKRRIGDRIENLAPRLCEHSKGMIESPKNIIIFDFFRDTIFLNILRVFLLGQKRTF